MTSEVRIDSSDRADLSRVIGWFISIRWIACICVVLSLIAVQFIFRYDLVYPTLYIITGVLCLENLIFTLYVRIIKRRRLARREMDVIFHLQALGDYIFLFLLVYFSGFLENPFAYFFLFYIMLTSIIFTKSVVYRYVAGLILVILGVSLAEYFKVIPHYTLTESTLTSYRDLLIPRFVGLCSTLIISVHLITNIRERIEEKGRKVEVELDRYKNLDRIKSNFILQVTHELRGPLAAVSGYHEMMLRGITGEITDRTADTLKKADRRTENLLTIIDEMIDFAFMKSEEENQYVRALLPLKETITENIRNHENHAQQKNIHLHSYCPRNLEAFANRDLINIILGNLINNAIKYSEPGKTIHVDAELTGKEVHLLVKDEGYGIEPEEMDKIFEEFYRTRRARQLEKDGTGLGLPIVKRAVESLGGRITVQSEFEKGTEFHIYLPVAETKNSKTLGGDS